MSEEEKVELSAVEAIDVLGWKKSKVYYWINSGKFETVQRVDGQKILLTRSEIIKLRTSNDISEKFGNFENSEEVQKNSVSNITKNYETEQNETFMETVNLFQNSLNSIEKMQQSFNFSLKLLTDGQADYKEQYFELKAEKKTIEENLKKSEKINNAKNIIIAILLLLLIIGSSLILYVWNNFEKFKTVQNEPEKIQQPEPVIEQVSTVENVNNEK